MGLFCMLIQEGRVGKHNKRIPRVSSYFLLGISFIISNTYSSHSFNILYNICHRARFIIQLVRE